MYKTFVAGVLAIAFTADIADQKIPELLSQDRDYATLSEELFGTMGWDLRDGGRAVKALADSAPGGAFDPKKLETLFSTMSSPLKGYRRMVWVVGSLDDGHWDPTPETAREWNFAKRFRQENSGTAIRVLLIAAPITHYGHIERPKQLAAVLVGAVRWVMQ